MEKVFYRVTNKCKFDIGVRLENGKDIMIRAGSFQLMDVNDILYVESVSGNPKLFASRKLVPYDNNNKEVPIETLSNGYIQVDENPHLDDNEIAEKVKMSNTKFKAWIDGIEDPIELHAIVEVAKKMDISMTKLKYLQDKIPNVDMLNS